MQVLRTAPLLPHINVTPMIDVMLVLLIIFMVVIPVIANTVDLPAAEFAEGRPEEPEDILLTIDARGAMFLEVAGQRAPGIALREQLTALYHDRERDRVLYLKADSTLPFGVVDGVMAAARASGVRVVAAVTERRSRPSM
jgi:biopolymer transport protein TolR